MRMYYPRSAYRVADRLRGRGRRWPASFADRLTHPVPTARAVTKMLRDGTLRGDLAQASAIPVREGARVPEAGPDDLAVTWVGHATCVVRIGGLVVLTDPVWSRRIPGVRPRYTPPGIAFADLPRVDAVVISHNHFDHLDAPTVRRLPRDTTMLVPAGLGWWLRRLGFRAVVELDWWESATVGGVRFGFVPSHHWSRRTPFDTCKSLWGGWMMSAAAGGKRVYFAGDSAYGEFFARIGKEYPGIDVALLPVGAFQPRWFMKPMHMDPAEAVRACADLGARRMVPIHWGTFALSAEPVLAPLEQARAAWAAAGRDRDLLWDLAIGEGRVLAASAAHA
ncbi:MAG TPA: MBL fold metallo-hydrolase [Rugosimonospora sp.]|nr:MBL fold metallo-hydrolase [Rugosimonospora sp.]